MKDDLIFSGREALAMAVAVDRALGGKYIKKHDLDHDQKNQRTNFTMFIGLAKNQPHAKNISVTDDDYSKADEIIDYFEGLIFKAMERNLTDYENKITEIIKATDLNLRGGDSRVPIIPSLPNVYRNNKKHDSWSDEERSLRKVSEFEGELRKRSEFSGVVKHVREMRRTNSLLVIVLTDNNNIVKFFYDMYRDPNIKTKIQEGKHIALTGFVKSHEVSRYSKCQETFLNKVNLIQEDK